MTQTQLIKFWMNLPWTDIRRQVTPLLPKFAFMLLIILLAQTFAELTWKLITPESADVVSKTASNSAQNLYHQDLASTASLRQVSQYHLFGEANKQPVVMQKLIDAPETRLKLILKGVFASSETGNAIAIIAGGKGDDTTYHIGDQISGGAVLHAVYPDRVILKRNGQLETLRLPQPKLESSAITTNYALSHNADAAVKEEPNEVNPANLTQSSSLREMRDTLLKEPAKIWQQVRINPIMENGGIKGYSMTHNDQALMQSLNIRPSDIITEVNGQPLSDPSTLYGLMNTLSQQTSLALTIERDGTLQTIELTF